MCSLIIVQRAFSFSIVFCPSCSCSGFQKEYKKKTKDIKNQLPKKERERHDIQNLYPIQNALVQSLDVLIEYTPSKGNMNNAPAKKTPCICRRATCTMPDRTMLVSSHRAFQQKEKNNNTLRKRFGCRRKKHAAYFGSFHLRSQSPCASIQWLMPLTNQPLIIVSASRFSLRGLPSLKLLAIQHALF